MKWLAIAGLVAIVVALLISLKPTSEPDRPEAPDTREKPDPVVVSEDEVVSADPPLPGGPASIEVMVRRDKEPAAARVEIRPLDRSSGLELPFNIVALAGSPVTLCSAPVTKPNRADAGPELTVRAGTTGLSLSTARKR